MTDPSLDLGRQILEEARSGEISPEMKTALAQGLMPLEEEILVEILFLLSTDSDEKIANAARTSLYELPDNLLAGMARSSEATPSLLHTLARIKVDSREVMRDLVLNRLAEDRTIEMVARHCELPQVLALIVGNQERLLRHTSLFETLLGNPALPGFQRNKLDTYREELRMRGQLDSVKPEPTAPETAGPMTVASEGPSEELYEFDLDLIGEFEEDEERPIADEEMLPFEIYAGMEQSQEERQQSIFQLIQLMNPAEKLRMATLGNTEARAILVRDGNRAVARAVMGNPKLKENEVERFCKMRNVRDEILRIIGMNRNWTKNYSIVHGLVENPKTPVGISIRLVSRLHAAHLKQLMRSKGIPAALKAAVKRRLTKAKG